MSADNPRTHWHAERPDADKPTRAELADPRAINHPWCGDCHCRHGHNDPWCTQGGVMSEKEHGVERDVTEMRLCEVTFVTPRPDRLYVFTVDESCEACAALASPYRASPPRSGRA